MEAATVHFPRFTPRQLALIQGLAASHARELDGRLQSDKTLTPQGRDLYSQQVADALDVAAEAAVHSEGTQL